MASTAFAKIFGRPPASRIFNSDELKTLWSCPITSRESVTLIQKTIDYCRNRQAAILRSCGNEGSHELKRNLHASNARNVPQDKLIKVVNWAFMSLGAVALGLRLPMIADTGMGHLKGPEHAKVVMAQLLSGLCDVGLAVGAVQRGLAMALDQLLDFYVEKHTLGPLLEQVDDDQSQEQESDVREVMEESSKRKTVREDPVVIGILNKPVLMRVENGITRTFEPLATSLIQHLGEPAEVSEPSGWKTRIVTEAEWKHIATQKLGRLRSQQLFDIIWKYRSYQWTEDEWDVWAHDDFTPFIETPVSREYLAETFIAAISRKLLLPGIATMDILEVYMRTINYFETLDPSRVLISRISQSFKSHLRDRDDAVGIILTSMLEPEFDDRGSAVLSHDNFCAPIAEMMREYLKKSYEEYFEGQDLKDLEWKPDPVDARPVKVVVAHANTREDHRRSAHLDAMAHLVELESSEAFIKELQHVLAERFLRHDTTHFQREIELLEMFKLRFAHVHTQQCEVMLRDVIESSKAIQRINESREVAVNMLRNLQHQTPPGTLIDLAPMDFAGAHSYMHRIKERLGLHVYKRVETLICSSHGGIQHLPRVCRELEVIFRSEPDLLRDFVSFLPRTLLIRSEPFFQAKVLSKFYWPPLKDETFDLPPEFQAVAERYTSAWEYFKRGRRLQWLKALGHVSVELELADRVVKHQVTTFQAAVILQFHGPGPMPKEPCRKTIGDIATSLRARQEPVHVALMFWVGKLVLRESSDAPDTFTVIERLHDPSGSSADEAERAAAASAAAAATAGQQADTGLKSEADQLKENYQLYSRFIEGMLTNQGAMLPTRIKLMLNVMVPGGFPFDESDLLWVLEEVAKEGKIEKAGTAWKVKKQQ